MTRRPIVNTGRRDPAGGRHLGRRRSAGVTGNGRAAPGTVIGLTGVIVTVTEEVPRILVVRHMTHALATPAQKGRAPDSVDSPDALPSGPFEPERHRTLELGLRGWVEDQTGLPLRHVEQLYTFGDRYRDSRELAGGPRVVSVGYIALTRQMPLSGTGEAEWRDWYGFFPWEDWRQRRPSIVDRIIRPQLKRWIEGAGGAEARARQERVSIAFGSGETAWDFERTLERYELLYEAGLVIEGLRDRQTPPPVAKQTRPPDEGGQMAMARALGAPMALDNRRVLSTALGRLRGKLKYRPLVFDLLPADFTLLQLQRVVEALGGVRLHKSNFRRLVVRGGLVEPTGRRESQAQGRPPELFHFRREVLRERAAAGVGLPTTRIGG